jgi:cysteinyl-tRNA synthetase
MNQETRIVMINGKPILKKNQQLITWYACGPTVYDSAHLGHARNYVLSDIMRRILESYFGFQVFFVMNITDIDDKILFRSKAKSIEEMKQFTFRIEKEFWQDLDALNVQRPDHVVHVTDQIPQMIQYIEKIIQNGYAYVNSFGDVYFDTEKYSQKYSYPNETSHTEGNIYLSKEIQKKHPNDFALWKSLYTLDEKVDMENDLSTTRNLTNSPIGWSNPWSTHLGRPGWHIECSTIASGVFGPHIDIHSGGIDLKFPHHANEEAQANAYYCRSTESSAEGAESARKAANSVILESATASATTVASTTSNDTTKDSTTSQDSTAPATTATTAEKVPWVSSWIHIGHLHIDGLKMSKSLKNFITIQDALKQMSSRELRLLFILGANWNSTQSLNRNYTTEVRSLDKTLQEYFGMIQHLERKLKQQKEQKEKENGSDDNGNGFPKSFLSYWLETKTRIDQAFRNNLNMREAMLALLDLIHESNRVAAVATSNSTSTATATATTSTTTAIVLMKAAADIQYLVETVFGLQYTTKSKDYHSQEENLTSAITALVDFRTQIRSLAKKKAPMKDYFIACDYVRDIVAPSLGIRIMDNGSYPFAFGL